MAIITNIPTYDMTTGQAIVQTTNLGSHQINILQDGTVTICDNGIDMPEHNFEAVEHVRLDELEQYRLLQELLAKFRMGGQ